LTTSLIHHRLPHEGDAVRKAASLSSSGDGMRQAVLAQSDKTSAPLNVGYQVMTGGIAWRGQIGAF